MKTSSTLILALAMATAVSVAEPPAERPGKDAAGPLTLPVAAGPFQPTMDSLTQYKCPEWFRDAKLGIWAHWGPQSAPMDGDWYARNLYIQGHPQYKDHLEHYGHPSKLGYKDIIPLWTAEKWDPERLMALYKKAGARYFVSMGVHHDNFDLWNSTHHKWNAVAMGPKRDVVGDWQKAARKEGLRFGVSEHLGASFTWFQPSHGSDKTGPLAGVPYDGADPKFEDLYHQPAAPDDKGWYSKDARWQQEWYNRIKDLVDGYHPDLLYSDGPVPFGNEVGRSMIAHLYNSDDGRHGGTVEAVYTCKQPSQGRWVEDLERGVMPGIRPEPWQTDTSIGDWFYNRNWKYRGADWVVHTLVDVVSKNGNLLINVVQRPDGSLDPEAQQTVERLADWVAVNGEGIFGTRPWLVHGEGPVRAKGGNFKEDFAYSARDVRFTSRGDNTLYAFILGWPAERRVVIRSLAPFPGVTGKITGVALLGHEGRLEWTYDTNGLTVRLPEEKPCDYAIALKITGEDLRGFKPGLAAPQVQAVAPDASGNYTLEPDEADLHGALQVETREGKPNIGHWDSARDSASWKVRFKEAGKFRVTARCATVHPESAVVVEVARQNLEARVPTTGSWDRYTDVSLGTVEVKQIGEPTVALRPRDEASWKAINVRWVKLVRAAE